MISQADIDAMTETPERQDMPDCVYLAPGLIRQAGGYPAALTTPDNPTAVKFVRADLYDAAQAEVARLTAALAEAEMLREGYGVLWRALADIVDSRTATPNATVRRILARAERALIEDPASMVKPVPQFYRLPPREQDGQEPAA